MTDDRRPTTDRARARPGPRRGFSLLEVQAAFVVLGLGVAALVPFALAQLKLVAALERRLPPGATYLLISNDHQMVGLLGEGGSGATGNPAPPVKGARAVAVDQVQPANSGSMDYTATVTVQKPAAGAGGS